MNTNGSNEQQKGLPLYKSPADHLRYGLSPLEGQFQPQHPVQVIQSKCADNEWAEKLDRARRQHGSHMAMRLATEKEIFSRNHRLPGLHSSNVSAQILMGTAERIGFEDILNGMLDCSSSSIYLSYYHFIIVG